MFCRHHHFVIGANMWSGEKYAYGAILIILVAIRYPDARLLNILYDIGPCLWGPWFM